LKEIGKIILFLIASVLLGALLAPPLFWTGRWLATEHGWARLADFGFEKYFNRAVLGSALLLLWPTARSLQVRNRNELGIQPDARRWRHFGAGFLASFLVMALLGGVLLWLGVCKVKSAPQWPGLWSVAASAAVVSLLEEFFFRGVILGLLRRTLHDGFSVLLSSGLYAIVHFLKPSENAVGDAAVRWWSGFQALSGVFWQFGEPVLLLAGFTTLFLVGCVLAMTTVRTRALWMATGLHAGWIFGTMGFGKVTRRAIKHTLPWIGENLSVGLVAVFCVGITGLVVWFFLRNEDAAADPTFR
jgi:membrane protease YdiL (CAAX protease family)